MAATMTIDEAAEKMHVHTNTALRLLATGELPGAKIGRAWVILLPSCKDRTTMRLGF